MDTIQQHLPSIIGSAVIVLVFLLPVLVIFDKLKTKSITSDIMDSVREEMGDIQKKHDAEQEKLERKIDELPNKINESSRQIVGDAIKASMAQITMDMTSLFDARMMGNNKELEAMKVENVRSITQLEGRIGQAEKDIDGLAQSLRGNRG